MIISIPSIVILTCYLVSLWGGSIRYSVPMLFAVGFIPMFGIGGLTGLPLGLATADIYLHDTYYVIGHFHYMVAPSVIFAVYAGVYYWYPKMFGKKLNTFLGIIHFFPTFILMNCIFFPMFFQGLAGMSRRLYDGGEIYAHAQGTLNLHAMISWSAWALAVFQLPFLINIIWSLFAGKKVESDNPWESTTLEWQTPTPPGHGNFTKEITVYRGPYEYSVPGASKDFTPQNEKEGEG